MVGNSREIDEYKLVVLNTSEKEFDQNYRRLTPKTFTTRSKKRFGRYESDNHTKGLG